MTYFKMELNIFKWHFYVILKYIDEFRSQHKTSHRSTLQYLISYNSKLSILRIVTWSYNCIPRIITSYLKPYNCANKWLLLNKNLTQDHISITFLSEYLKLYNYVQIICIR